MEGGVNCLPGSSCSLSSSAHELRLFCLHLGWNEVIQYQAFPHPHHYPKTAQKSLSKLVLTIHLQVLLRVLKPKTGNKSSISNLSFQTWNILFGISKLSLLKQPNQHLSLSTAWLKGPIHSKNTLVTVVEFKRRQKHILSVSAHCNMAQEGQIKQSWDSQVDNLVKVRLKSSRLPEAKVG